jgi:hypothetical protein
MQSFELKDLRESWMLDLLTRAQKTSWFIYCWVFKTTNHYTTPTSTAAVSVSISAFI